MSHKFHSTVVSYIVSGRDNESSDWSVISEGDLPWRYTGNPSRNDLGLSIASSYESGDTRRTYTEVTFEGNSLASLEYKIEFPDRRVDGTTIAFAEVELPGVILASDSTLSPITNPTQPPTPQPSPSPTQLPTSNPSHAPTLAPVAPTQPPTSLPTSLPTASPISHVSITSCTDGMHIFCFYMRLFS